MSDGAPRAIRFVEAEVDIVPDEQCQAVVKFEGSSSNPVTATAQGGSGQADQLRAVARAAADAVSEMFDTEGVRVRVRGVQLVEAFAQTIIVVSLAASKGPRTQMLLGVSDGGEDLTRATAVAVLNATNRFLGQLDAEVRR
jgi:hypothetical protein